MKGGQDWEAGTERGQERERGRKGRGIIRDTPLPSLSPPPFAPSTPLSPLSPKTTSGHASPPVQRHDSSNGEAKLLFFLFFAALLD